MPSSDPCQERRLEQERQKREKYLQRKVQETLSLAAPEQPTTEKEFKAQSHHYKDKLRKNRILQVRAQEMLFASQRIAEFRDRKTKDSKMLINHLKEVWTQDQRQRIANLEEEYAHACQSIGLSHDAATLIERNKKAKEELLTRQREESRYWDTLRFEEAMQKEREQKEMRERCKSASTLRRKIVESVSNIEQSFARRYNHGAKPKAHEKKAYGCSQAANLPVTHDITREKVYSKLAGFPIDFKDTYLHSRFDVLQDRTNKPTLAVVNSLEEEKIDAWHAAEQLRENNRCERAHQIELERLYNERKLERGTAAAAKLLNDQRIVLLEQEVEEAFTEEEREQDRLLATTNSSTCKQATSPGQQRRCVYTKHKISKPLSCPDSPIITQSSENQQELLIESQMQILKKPKSLQGHPITDAKKNALTKIDVQGTKIQLVDLVSHHGRQSVTIENEAERGLIAQRLSNRKSNDGSIANFSIQQSSIDGKGSIIEPLVTKSLPHSLIQTKRKKLSPIETPCEQLDLITLQSEEGKAMKQPHVKSPNKCPLPKQNADGSERTGKRQFSVSKRDADYVARLGKRWRSQEKEREKDYWVKHLSDKASPSKTQYHMELVQEVAEVEKEVEQYYKGVHYKKPMRSASAAPTITYNVIHNNIEIQRSQRDPSNGIRPPFISSGTIGYKKILPAPLIVRPFRATCESEGIKAVSSNDDKVSLVQNVREDLKVQRRVDVEHYNANVHTSSLKDRYRPSSAGIRAKSLHDINKKSAETSKSWAHPLRFLTRLGNFQEERQTLKTRNQGAKWANLEDRSNDDQRLQMDSPIRCVTRDSSILKKESKGVSSRIEMHNGLTDTFQSTKMIFEIGKSEKDNAFRKGNGLECQEKRVQEPKPRQKAVWKSYIDEKKQATRRNLEILAGNQPIKSEPSSPRAPINKVFSSRPKIGTNKQGDYQTIAKLNEPIVNENVGNCHTPLTSIKSLPNSRSKFRRDNSVQRSWKYLQANPKCIELEALENISTRMKSLSNRFHSPMAEVPPEISSRRRNFKDQNSKEKNVFISELSVKPEKCLKLEDTRSSCEAIISNPNDTVAEEGGTRKDVGPKSATSVADTLITAWKTGKFQEDYAKAMKRAKEITSGSCSSGVSKMFSDRNYRKPWLSKSPLRRRRQGREVDDVSFDNHKQNERTGSAKRKSPVTCYRYKPWVSPARRSPDRMMHDQDNNGHYLKSSSANRKKNSNNPKECSNAARGQSHLGPEISKSSPAKVRIGKKETSKDPWEGQSLDFVLGSLAEQVRELDERIRSATTSSPALSSTSSLDGESHVPRNKQNINQPPSRLRDNHQKDCGKPSLSSAASSPEHCFRGTSRGPPAARNVWRASTSANPSDRAAGQPAVGGTYMDELKTLLREISIDNPSPLRRHRVTRSPASRHEARDSKSHSVHDIVKKTELLCSTNKSRGALRATAKAEVEADSVSSSAKSSRACSVTSGRDRRETRVVVMENGSAPGVGIERMSGNRHLDRRVMHDGLIGNGNANGSCKRERASNPVINRTFEVRDVREIKTYEKRNGPEANGFREESGISRVMEKRLVQSRWTEAQAAEHGSKSVCGTVEKRAVEVRSCAPHQVIQSGQAVIREQLVKEVLENGLPSPELNGHGSFRKNTATSVRDRSNHGNANGNLTPVRRIQDTQGFYVPQHRLPNGKPAVYENAKDPYAEHQRRPASAHAPSNGHKLSMRDPRRRPTTDMKDQTREYALSNGAEKLQNRQPEVPVRAEVSPHVSGSWRKGGVNLDAAEDRMLLSGSVDFSPWNTAKLPDIGASQTAAEKRSRSKPASPVAEVYGNGNLSPQLQRSKPPPQLIKALGPRPTCQEASPNGVHFLHSSPDLARDSSPAKASSLRTQARPNSSRPKPVPRGVDALWSLTDHVSALKPSAALNGGPPARTRSPYEKKSPVRNKKRPASIPKSRLVQEQNSSSEEMPESVSKSSQEDNYLPVVMARDPESRQRVIERRRKALQLDMEHRQRLRNSRPSSARNYL